MTGSRRPRPGPRDPDGPAPVGETDPPLPGALVALGVLALVLVAALGAVVSVLLTPARIGTTLVPFSVVVAVGLNVALPVLAYRIAGTRGVAALPVLVFFVAGWALSIGPGGDVLLAGGSDGQTATSYATLLLPVVVGAVTAVRVR